MEKERKTQSRTFDTMVVRLKKNCDLEIIGKLEVPLVYKIG